MNDFDKFLKIPTKEIAKRTHILEEVIDKIKNKKFADFKVRTHFYGFVSSISSEYELDITKDLLNQYDLFYNTQEKNTADVKIKIEKATPIKEDLLNTVKKEVKGIKNNEMEDTNIDDGNSLLIIIAIIALSIFLFVYITKDNKSNVKNNTIKQEVKKKIQKVNDIIVINKEVDRNIKKKVLVKSVLESKKYTFPIKNKTKVLDIKNNRLYLSPFRGNKLWLGIINLNNKKQIGEVLKGFTSYNIKSNTIILTGHGYVNLRNENNEKKSYRTLKKLYFYYKNNTLYKINKKDVIALNGGFVW